MKLTYDKIVNLLNGLNALETDGKFICDDEKIPSRIAININRLEPHKKAFDKRVNQIRIECFGKVQEVLRNHPKMDDFTDKIEALKATEVEEEIKILQCTRAELKVKENQLSGPVLRKLQPMISDFDADV